jgi:hypothetical protein
MIKHQSRQVLINWCQFIKTLRCVVVVGEGFSRLGFLSGGSPLSLFDMLLARRRGLET